MNADLLRRAAENLREMPETAPALGLLLDLENPDACGFCRHSATDAHTYDVQLILCSACPGGICSREDCILRREVALALADLLVYSAECAHTSALFKAAVPVARAILREDHPLSPAGEAATGPAAAAGETLRPASPATTSTQDGD